LTAFAAASTDLTSRRPDMAKEKQLWQRIYEDPCSLEIVRFIGYEGKQYRQWNEKLQELIQKYGRRAESASWYLLTFESQHRVNPSPLEKVELRKEVRKCCWGLLGVPPDHPLYYFWTVGPCDLRGEDASRWEAEYRAKLKAEQEAGVPGETPQPPKGEATHAQEERAPKPGTEGQAKEEGEPPAGEPGLSPEAYALAAKVKNKRSLLCMLRDARRKLRQHGKRSFSGKEAKKEIAAAEAELTARGMEIPPEGKETAAWDRRA
jgi:hypothetical protein